MSFPAGPHLQWLLSSTTFSNQRRYDAECLFEGQGRKEELVFRLRKEPLQDQLDANSL